MLHHLFTNLAETGILGQVGDVTMHLAIHLNILYHILAVGLEATVKVVQVLDTRHLARSSVEELRGQCLRQRVVTLLLVARHEIVALLSYHAIQARDLVRRILQVGIHSDDHITLGTGKATVQGGRLAIVTAELDSLHLGVLGMQFLDDLPRIVGGAIIHEVYLI